MTKKHVQKKTKTVPDEVKKIPEGLTQTFTDSKGKTVRLRDVITPNDVWETNGKSVKRIIVTHDGVKKIADRAGVSKEVKYNILTQPDAYNNYQYTIEARVCMQKSKDDCAVEIGEANRSNLGGKGRNNPANMAQKRAYDRAVFRLIGITGLLSEEELADEEIEEDKMDKLSHDERKQIAPLLNQLLLAKEKKNLVEFDRMMKSKAKSFNEEQINYIRELYKKKVGELTTSAF